jgi:hypothetical protein
MDIQKKLKRKTSFPEICKTFNTVLLIKWERDNLLSKLALAFWQTIGMID